MGVNLLLGGATLVRERPGPEVIPDVAPETVKSFRLQNKKNDDQRPENDET
jgi:hypothetical protein